MSEPAIPFPDGVPLTIPASWTRPTPSQPVPVVRCTYIYPDTHQVKPGMQCKAWSLRGCLKCIKHGGQLTNVREHAAAVVEAARLRLVGNADMAVDVLEDLMANATSEAVRLKATTEVLDRAGVRGGSELDVSVTASADPGQALRDRLSTIRSRVIDVSPEPAGDTLANVRTASEELDVD